MRARWTVTSASSALGAAFLAWLVTASPLHHARNWDTLWPGLWVAALTLGIAGVVFGRACRGWAGLYGVGAGITGGVWALYAGLVYLTHGLSDRAFS